LPDILILAGKEPRQGTVLSSVEARLTERGLTIRLGWRDPISDIEDWPSGLVVQRGVSDEVLTALAARGGSILNDPSACLRLGDRSATLSHLASAGLPVPRHRVCREWAEVAALARSGAIYVKAGGAGRGAGVARIADPEDAAPFPGPWHVEVEQPGDGIDRKIYVVGDRAFGLLKRWPRDGDAAPFTPTAAMRDLARRAGAALGLEIYGVDLVGEDGRCAIVDVNAFPGFRGVTGAFDAVADYIAARAR
jgi:ribosomal protein S6--L-glutamate ligase